MLRTILPCYIYLYHLYIKKGVTLMENIEISIQDRILRSQLATVRKSKHLTQEDMAKRSGLSISCISNIENGELSSPTLRSLLRYADALNVNLCVHLKPNDKEYNNTVNTTIE